MLIFFRINYCIILATRPLVRQIENLQATYNAQTISWEKIEKNLTDRLSNNL